MTNPLHIPSKLHTRYILILLLFCCDFNHFLALDFIFQSEVQSHYFRLNDLPTKTRPSASPRPRQVSRSNPRPISDSQLHALLHFHPCPIYLVVFKGSYFFRMRDLILRGASRLDAFSVYPFPTWLPGHRLGSLTGTPAVRPSRSSRTKDSSSQISYAHAG